MLVGKILSLLSKYSLLFLTCQPPWAAANLTAFPTTNSNVGTTCILSQCHIWPGGIGGIMRNHPRGGSRAEHLSRLEEEAMASLCRDIINKKEPGLPGSG